MTNITCVLLNIMMSCLPKANMNLHLAADGHGLSFYIIMFYYQWKRP